MNKAAREHIVGLLDKGVRLDGRKLDEYRKIELESGFIKTAEGSARVIIGDTQVIAGVKMSLEKPYPDTPDKGNLMVGAELTPLSSRDFEAGPPSIQSIELARVTDRGIRESKMIDTEKLCFERGEKVWSVMIDINSINDAGNLFDAGSLGAVAALKSAQYPVYDGEKIDYKKHEGQLPLNKIAVSVTVLKIGKHLVVDPLSEEEKVADARLTVSLRDDGKICAMQKGGVEALTDKELKTMVELATEKSKELRKLL